MRLFCILLLCVLTGAKSLAQLAAGPLWGHTDLKMVRIWVQTEQENTVQLRYWVNGAPKKKYLSNLVKTSREQGFTAQLEASPLEPGTSYQYEILLNGKPASKKLYTFETQAIWRWRSNPPNMRIALGSCHYGNQPAYDRPGKPYGDSSTAIFKTIAAQNPDMMLWLGDNIYLREPDWNSCAGIYARYAVTRTDTNLSPLLQQCPQLAIWDDHDFGPNDANGAFWNKTCTKEAFLNNWPNPSPRVEGLQGITSVAQWYDATIFLLDNRWYRANLADSTEETILGKEQLAWLKDALLMAPRYDFKLICMGGQFLNTAARFENYALWEKEREELIRFIQDNNIRNVIFLTGDRHHAELSKLEAPGKPVIYDFTVSPLTSGVSNAANKEDNALRVPGTLYAEDRNFGMLEFSGAGKDRKVQFVLYNKTGQELYRISTE